MPPLNKVCTCAELKVHTKSLDWIKDRAISRAALNFPLNNLVSTPYSSRPKIVWDYGCFCEDHCYDWYTMLYSAEENSLGCALDYSIVVHYVGVPQI